jgi:hypothetical protein
VNDFYPSFSNSFEKVLLMAAACKVAARSPKLFVLTFFVPFGLALEKLEKTLWLI